MKKLFIILCLFVLAGCSNASEGMIYERLGIHMGTTVEIQIYGQDMEWLLDEAFTIIAEFDQRLTVVEPGFESEVQRINEMAGIAPVEVSASTLDLILQSITAGDKTGGRLDITVGPLTGMWRWAMNENVLPDKDELIEGLLMVNYQAVKVDIEEQTVFLPNAGMQLDLGGVAKGFVADYVGLFLRSEGVEHAIINMGGDLVVLGTHPTGNPWNIGVLNPFEIQTQRVVMGVVESKNQAVITSGVYERYAVIDGVRYHHIIDPQSGMPFQSDIISITVVAETGFLGEVYTISAFAMDAIDALEYIEDLSGIEAIIVTDEKDVLVTSGLQETFVLLDDSFTKR